MVASILNILPQAPAKLMQLADTFAPSIAPSEVFSRMCYILAHDLLEVSLVMSCVVFGWFLVTCTLFPASLGDDGPKKGCSKHSVHWEDLEVSEEASSEEPSVAGSAKSAGLALLEHHGVFGAAPGSWLQTPEE